MIRFDTLAFVQRLTAAGFAREQAEAIVEGLAEADTSQVASKADITELRHDLGETKAELKADLAALKAELKADLVALRTEAKADLAALKAEAKADLQAQIGRLELKLGEFKTDLFRHMLVQTGVIVGAVIALMKLIP
jgi:F0F1-type ATP synthase membrane subunit b/b'